MGYLDIEYNEKENIKFNRTKVEDMDTGDVFVVSESSLGNYDLYKIYLNEDYFIDYDGEVLRCEEQFDVEKGELLVVGQVKIKYTITPV